MAKNEIRYLGWSNILIETEQGSLAFDPFFRPMYGANYATLEDYNDVKVICVSHGHHEHYMDTAEVIKSTGAVVVSSQEVCDHLHSYHQIPQEKLIPVKPLQEVVVNGFKITPFTWYHRKISYWNFFKGNLRAGLTFALTNLLQSPYKAPYYGFLVQGPGGLRFLNFSEGFNSFFPDREFSELGKRFKPDILVGGMQLSYENDVARGTAAISPKALVLYHPHTKMFDLMKIKSSSPETFANEVKKAAPNVKVYMPGPGEALRTP